MREYRRDNPETLAPLVTQDTERRQTQYRGHTIHRTKTNTIQGSHKTQNEDKHNTGVTQDTERRQTQYRGHTIHRTKTNTIQGSIIELVIKLII